MLTPVPCQGHRPRPRRRVDILRPPGLRLPRVDRPSHLAHPKTGERISSTTTAPTRMPTAGSRASAKSSPRCRRRTSRPILKRPDSAWLAARRKSWARLIKRVYEADPLLCPCGQKMRVVGFITQAPVIRKILTHIGRREGLFPVGQTDPATESRRTAGWKCPPG